MSIQVQRWCAWSGVAFTVLFIAGFLIAGFVPPPPPTLDPAGIAGFYGANQLRIHIGLLICSLSAPLITAWIAGISLQMRRIEGNRSPLAFAQGIAGAALVLEFLFPFLMWQTAAYRSDRDPAIVQALNDLGWLCFLGIPMTAAFQGVVFGLAVLRDGRATPRFPRWVGYFNIWICMMYVPASFCVLTQTGPIAWNGLISWWLAAVTYFIWMIGVTYALLRAIRAEQAEVAAADEDGRRRIALDLDLAPAGGARGSATGVTILEG
jgi:hypothetical protein